MTTASKLAERFARVNYQPGMQDLPLLFCGLLFLVAGHLKLANDGGHALLLPFNALGWLVLLAFIIVTAAVVLQRKTLTISSLTRGLLFCGLLLTLPVLYPGAAPLPAAYRLAGVWAGLAFLLALGQYSASETRRDLLLLTVLGAVWLEALRYWWLMFSDFSLGGGFPPIEDFELFGVFQQRNVFASFIASGLVLSGYLLTRIEGMPARRWIRLFLLVSPLLLAQLLHTMASRAGWYGAVIGIALLLPLLIQRLERRVVLTWLGMLAAGFCLSWVMVALGDWQAPQKNILTMTGPRTILFSQAIAMFLDRPWLGFGYGHFEPAYIQFAAEQYAAGSSSQPAIAETFHPHNEFLFWGVEGGLVPVAGLLLAAILVWRTVARFPLAQRLAIVGLFFPLALHSQVEFPFYASVMHWALFILLIHYVDSLQGESRSIGSVGLVPSALAVALGSGAAMVFLVLNLQAGLTLARFNDRQETMGALLNLTDRPVFADRINYTINVNFLLRGIAVNNPDYVRRYTDWAPQLIVRTPRPIFYEYLIQGYEFLGESRRATAYRDEFRYYFPERAFTVIEPND